MINSTINAGAGFNEIDLTSRETSTQCLNIFGNTLDGGGGMIRLNEVGGDINVTQGAPGSGVNGIDAINGIPAGNVLIPGNVIDFNQPACPTP